MKVAIRPRKQPAVWKFVTGVVVQMHGKDAYMKLKAYHSISLLGCIEKVAEKVVVELSPGEAKRRGRLKHGQFEPEGAVSHRYSSPNGSLSSCSLG